MNRLVFVLGIIACLSQLSFAQSPKRRGRRKPLRIRLSEVRSYSGVDNHPDDYGAADQPLLRIGPADYPDGAGEMICLGANPRRVKTVLPCFTCAGCIFTLS